MRERFPAMAGALALVVVALVVRVTVLGGSDDDPDHRSGGSTPTGEVVVACDPTLAAVCEAVAEAGLARVHPEGLSLPDGTEPPADVDVWITWGGAPLIANFDAENTWDRPETVASAPLALLHTPEAFGDSCPDEVTWVCLAEGADLSRPFGVGRPDSAEGLARLFPLAEALVPDDGDFRDIPSNRLQVVVDGPVDGQGPLETQINQMLTRPGALVAVVGPTARLNEAQDRPGPARLTVTQPTPLHSTAVVAVSRVDGASLDPDRLRSDPTLTPVWATLGLEPSEGPSPDPGQAGGSHAIRQVLR